MKLKFKSLKNSKGFLAVDFIFSLFFSLGLFVLMLNLTTTLSVVEVLQYMSFVSAREYSLGNITPEAQLSAAKARYDRLTQAPDPTGSGGRPPIVNLFTNGWFEVGEPQYKSSIGTDSFVVDYPSIKPEWGAGSRISFNAKIMNTTIPFIGGSSEENFTANVYSPMVREVTRQECMDILLSRWSALLNLRGGLPGFKPLQQKFVVMEDSGC